MVLQGIYMLYRYISTFGAACISYTQMVQQKPFFQGGRKWEDTTLQSLISNLPPSLFHIEIHHARSRGTWSALLKHIFNQTPAIRHLYISQCGDPLLTDILSIIFLGYPVEGEHEVYLLSLQLVVFFEPSCLVAGGGAFSQLYYPYFWRFR